MARVVVVGAGIAGLACAWRLAEAGHEVEVLERERAPGGRMRSERHGDFVLDRGAQFVASGYRNLRWVMGCLGLTGAVRPLTESANAVLHQGRFVAGWDSPARLLGSPQLPLRAKAGAARVALQVLRRRRQLDPLRPEGAAGLDREDLATWARRLGGPELLDLLLGPAFSSTFDSEPEHLSAAFAKLALRFVGDGFRLQWIDGGLGRVTGALAERVPVRLGAQVTAVESDPDGVTLRHSTPTGERSRRVDAAVVAVPGSRVAALCPGLRDGERAFFERVRYVRGAIVHLLLDEPPPALPYYGVAFPRSAGLDLYGVAVDHHKPGAAPPGSGLVNAALTEAAAARLWSEPDGAFIDAALQSLARTPAGKLFPRHAVVHRWDPMLPRFRAGYLPRLGRFLSRADRSPRLVFAGDYLVGPYTEAALTSGLRAATETARLLTPG